MGKNFCLNRVFFAGYVPAPINRFQPSLLKQDVSQVNSFQEALIPVEKKLLGHIGQVLVNHVSTMHHPCIIYV